MSSYCPDCGCRTSSGICSNCQEELHILTFQNEHIDQLSQKFMDKATKQKKLLAKEKAQ